MTLFVGIITKQHYKNMQV